MATQRRSKQAVLEAHAPWRPADFEDADAVAFQALTRGNATADQQKRALDWLVKKCCRTYDLNFRPGGEEGRRDTDFAEGKRAVGLEVVKLCNIKIGNLLPKQG